ncbi:MULTISPECIES: SMI1/KNR4 family protein [Stenotrophomonas]|uniref:SMI1/KNR4 family protein n=1 Tax=Stenotrophomonas bentonitica TaxID=1450134 RepID=A0ABU9JSC4_9GAMM|nr:MULTISPECIES: SMI1/KNR4 family protein [Stenotrophomonas]MDX5517745.1 SMI1/KNR4 family protein [Stenotrophomonas sp. RG-453]
MPIATPHDIEQQLGQAFPALYHQLQGDRMLDWGTFCHGWVTSVYPTLRARPPLLLYAREFELIAPADIVGHAEQFTDEDSHVRLRERLQLLPFGSTGAGDYYCFWQDPSAPGEPRVVLLWHDDDRVDLLATNLQDFIFRMMVDAVADLDDCLLEEGDIADNLQRWLRSHRPYLRAAQVQALEELYADPAIHAGGVGEDVATALIRRVIGFEGIDTHFSYVPA